MMLSSLFSRCLNIEYTNVQNDVSYATEIIEDELYIYFEGSNGCTDWKNNLDFPAIRVKNGGFLFAHRGFLRVFESIRVPLAKAIVDPAVAEIVTVG